MAALAWPASKSTQIFGIHVTAYTEGGPIQSGPYGGCGISGWMAPLMPLSEHFRSRRLIHLLMCTLVDCGTYTASGYYMEVYTCGFVQNRTF